MGSNPGAHVQVLQNQPLNFYYNNPQIAGIFFPTNGHVFGLHGEPFQHQQHGPAAANPAQQVQFQPQQPMAVISPVTQYYGQPTKLFQQPLTVDTSSVPTT